jgi:hypothetical protein
MTAHPGAARGGPIGRRYPSADPPERAKYRPARILIAFPGTGGCETLPREWLPALSVKPAMSATGADGSGRRTWRRRAWRGTRPTGGPTPSRRRRWSRRAGAFDGFVPAMTRGRLGDWGQAGRDFATATRGVTAHIPGTP